MSATFLAVFLFSLIPIVYFLIICLTLILNSDIDIRLIISTVVALLSASILFSLYLLAVTLRYKKTLVAWLASVIFLLGLFVIDDYLRNSGVGLSIYLDFFIHMREGLIDVKEIFTVVNWMLIFFLLLLFSWLKLRLADNSDVKDTLMGVVALIASNIILIKGMDISRWDMNPVDISQSRINSLSDSLAEQIAVIDKTIKITAVIDEKKNQDEIRRAVDIIAQYNENTELNFTNRQALMQQSNFVDQFITVEIDTLQQSVRYPFEDRKSVV